MEASSLIRSARRAAGLSQAELAGRAGVSQPVVSAYEKGRREPGLRMLTALVEAAGHELIVDVRPHASLRRGLPDTRLGRRLRRHRPAIVELLAAHGARHAQVFGSVARGDDGADSDIDLLVELDASVGLVGLAGLVRELGALLATDVDVVPIDSLKPGVREAVLAEAIPL